MKRASIATVLAGCGVSATHQGYDVVATSGAPLEGLAGDAVDLTVVERLSDGTTRDLPDLSTVTWSGAPVATALAVDSSDPSPIPRFGAAPTAVFARNAHRADIDVPRSTLFLLDPGWTEDSGAVHITARVASTPPEDARATVTFARRPTGDATRGGATYAASCATCHGPTGHGTPASPDGTFLMLGTASSYPAPGLNAERGNLASDPAWNAAVFAFASRSDMDDGGVTLRAPMPSWLSTTNPETRAVLSTQDFADVYAFLATQTH